MSDYGYNMECDTEDFAHAAASLGWDKAARAVDAHLRSRPKDDPWTADYATALRGIAAAFLSASAVESELKDIRKSLRTNKG